VTQSAASAMDVSFSWATSNGTAIAGTNYTSVASGSATITAGQTTASLSIPILVDGVITADKTFQVQISNPNQASISQATSTVTIHNTDALPSLSIAGATVNENAGRWFLL
jgi:hypothetical protein